MTTHYFGLTDEYGGRIKWQNGTDANDTVYSDRLYQWDYEKYNSLCRKHFGKEGQMFYGREPKAIEAFLCDYMGQAIKLVKITEYTNAANGYPVWRFDYRR